MSLPSNILSISTKPVLHSAHFQLTGCCNLHCTFCGQNRGMLSDQPQDLSLEKWISLGEEVLELAQSSAHPARVMLWGGEPLLCPFFDEVARGLHQLGIKLSLVTNGTMLDKHLETVAEHIDIIFVSLDGPQEFHDAVRGSGVFARVSANLKELNKIRRGELHFLTTVNDNNVEIMSQLPTMLTELGPDGINLQPLMYLTKEEIANYRNFSREHFGCDYPELQAWQREDDTKYLASLKRELGILERTTYPVKVTFTPHFYPWHSEFPPCTAAWNRVHIRHDGEVGFCTDYFNFSLGNVKVDKLSTLFYNDKAEFFRQSVLDDRLPVCRHCPWRGHHFA